MAKLNRAGAQNFILQYIGLLAPKTDNVEIYKKLFAAMSDKAFDEFMKDLESGEKHLALIAPNFNDTGLSVENNLAVADKLGHNFFPQIWIEGKGDVPTYLTPNTYLVADCPVRRASQTLVKKVSIPKHQRVVDSLTGQPTGESKGAKISYPEVQIAAAMGLEDTLIELVKYRGGDARGRAAMSAMISKYGRANIKTLSQYASGVESTRTLRTFLTAAHLRNNL